MSKWVSDWFEYSDVAICILGKTWIRLKPGKAYRVKSNADFVVYHSMDFVRDHWAGMYGNVGMVKSILTIKEKYGEDCYNRRSFKKPLDLFVLLEIERVMVDGPFLFAAKVLTPDGETGVICLGHWDLIKPAY